MGKLTNIWGKIKSWENNLDSSKYWLVRFWLLRFLGLTYFFAFISLALQVLPLLGSEGILPIDNFLNAIESQSSFWHGFKELPSLFWFHISDPALVILAWLGVIISLAVLLGYANVPMLFANWAIYMSFVHVGQRWYGYGWEIQLLETGFLAMFLVPLWNPKPFPKNPPPVPIIWLFRWLAFRIHIGAGMIKMRGSQCWENLTCLYHHYETQPIPNPLSPFFHRLPDWFHQASVVATHFVQLITPWFVFLGRILRNWGGSLMLGFQAFLMLTGNYAFLNLVTMVAIIAYFDDSFLEKITPKSLLENKKKAVKNSKKPSKWRKAATWTVVALVILLSVPVVANLLSSGQAMNTSFNSLDLVNTYGAFGSIGKVRNELIIEGTSDSTIDQNTPWRAYDFKYKPGPVKESLPVIAPYQPRMEWQLWFAAMSRPEREPWLIHYTWKLLHNDEEALKLVENNPFPNEPPEYIRIRIYRYNFSEGEAVWERKLLGTWLQPISRDNVQIRNYVERRWG